MFGSILTFGAMIGAITIGPIADFIGRKGVNMSKTQGTPLISESRTSLLLFPLINFLRPTISGLYKLYAGHESVQCFLRCRLASYILC